MGTFENCNCQCNSDTWTDGQYIRGNCRSKDRNGALFCYVSGSALCSCRDVQVSSFLKNNQGRFKLYSYEACTTPPRNQCRNQGSNSNLGDGDFPYCLSNNNNFGGSSNYRPSNGISSSSGYRPGTGNVYNPPRNTGNNRPSKPSLGDILSGVRTGSGSSSGSSDSSSSSGAISFDA